MPNMYLPYVHFKNILVRVEDDNPNKFHPLTGQVLLVNEHSFEFKKNAFHV